jgi:FHA domain
MPTCPSGHDSGSTDFCDVCGIRMGGPAPAASQPAEASPAAAAPVPAGAAVPGEPCPQCGAPRTGQFCEVCGFNFAGPPAAAWDGQAAPGSGVGSGDGAAGPGGPGSASAGDGTPGPAVVTGSAGDAGAGAVPAVAPVPGAGAMPDAGAVPAAAAVPDAVPVPGAAAGWTAVVTADRAYYDSVVAEGGPDASSIEFPGYCPERRFRLTSREMRIGRRSVSRGLEPEIDLTGPPTDPGVSHLHAVLIAEPDGTWSVLDPGSANGTTVNGGEVVAGVRVPLHDGDRICVGAWTVLTMQPPPAG